MKVTKPLFSCNFEIFKINPNVAVREHRLLQSFRVIVKEKTKMEVIEKEERKRACENFSIENGQFLYKRQRAVVMAKQELLEIMKFVHEDVGQSTHSKAMASHKGRGLTYLKISLLR